MKQFVDLQRQEFLTLVRAETEPLQCAVNQIHSNVRTIAHDTFQVSERMTTLENRVAQFQIAGSVGPVRDANDPAYSQIAFLNFPADSYVYQKLTAMKSFMAANFKKNIDLYQLILWPKWRTIGARFRPSC